jgi:hypothetical protein
MKAKINNLLNNKNFQKMIDVIRILLFVIAIVILIVLICNIEEVKILNSNVCDLCMKKTGATCISKIIT